MFKIYELTKGYRPAFGGVAAHLLNDFIVFRWVVIFANGLVLDLIRASKNNSRCEISGGDTILCCGFDVGIDINHAHTASVARS